MQTPNTTVGNRTELIMFRAVENIKQCGDGELTTAQYNSIYEAVLETLTDAHTERPPT